MKRFLGWEPVTTYETDEGGRLLSSRTESEWDEVEQSWMLALQFYRDGLCPKCGGPVDECRGVENEFRYVVDPPERCHKTTAVHTASESYRKNDKVPVPDALVYGLREKDATGSLPL